MAYTINVGDHVPDFALRGTDGREYRCASAREQGVLAFVFYKRTCHTCQFSFPYLQRLHAQYAGPGFQLWGVAQESPEDAAAFAAQLGATFPQLPDTDLEVTERYAPQSVPSLYVTDRSGRVLHYAPAFIKDEYNAVARLAADRTGQPYTPIVREEDGAPVMKPG